MAIHVRCEIFLLFIVISGTSPRSISATSRIQLGVTNDLNDQFPDNGDRPLFNKDLVEGDILGRKSNKERLIYAYSDFRKIWPSGLIHYDLDRSLESSRLLIMGAMKQIQDKTCVQFLERRLVPNPEDIVDYVLIKDSGAECASHVGRAGGKQLLSLGPGCLNKGHVLHELAHTVGLEHEHSRSDRKYHLDIDWANIPQDFWDKFEAADPLQENLLDEPFDLTSVMMFSDLAFAKHWHKPSILPHENVTLEAILFKTNLSQSDVNRINKIYQCFNWTLPPPPKVNIVFHCDFEKSDCGIVNQANMGSYFWRRDLQAENKTTVREKGKSLAMGYATSLAGRLIVPPQRVYSRSEGCLTFEHGKFPKGVDYLEIVQESSERRILLQNMTFDEDVQQPWNRVQLNLNTAGETEIKFIITVYVKYLPGDGPINFEDDNLGFVVLDNFSYSRTKCQ